MSKFTFKREPRLTGLAGIASPHADVQIKLAGEQIGILRGPNPHASHMGWKASFAIKADAHPGWVWVRMAHEDASEDEARAWLQRQADNIIAKYALHAFAADA